ncbi:MAG TPA: hypothetical protein DCX06_07125 [Opitutae bacterium]|nr:hypothetical protein [Opitutae bacterium]
MFPTNKALATQHLEEFLPRAGIDYTSTRNYDYGRGWRQNVSMLSPCVRLRLLPEWEICRKALAHYKISQASKFIDEVCWRTYWKGWLEQRPSVWATYLTELKSELTNRFDGSEYHKITEGNSGIKFMDTWTRELKETGYLHNHTRMWYASIWIHTLKLPWVLGADFFMRHLLDADPASNTLSWRWVAGLHTPGKCYLAQADNIRKFTNGQINPDIQLATEPAELALSTIQPEPERLTHSKPLPTQGRIGLLLHDEDLSAASWLKQTSNCESIAGILPVSDYRCHKLSASVTEFRSACLKETLAENDGTYCTTVEAVLDWAQATKLDHVIMAQPSVGIWSEVLPTLETAFNTQNIQLTTKRHWWDEQLFPHATAGFFKFKKAIPSALTQLETPLLKL